MECIPSAMALRNMEVKFGSTLCLFCGLFDECVDDILIGCTFAKKLILNGFSNGVTSNPHTHMHKHHVLRWSSRKPLDVALALALFPTIFFQPKRPSLNSGRVHPYVHVSTLNPLHMFPHF